MGFSVRFVNNRADGTVGPKLREIFHLAHCLATVVAHMCSEINTPIPK